MLAGRLKRLRDTFAAWSEGERFPTEEEWRDFHRELKSLTADVAILELGIDLSVVDVAVAEARSEIGERSNVVQFRPLGRGGIR